MATEIVGATVGFASLTYGHRILSKYRGRESSGKIPAQCEKKRRSSNGSAIPGCSPCAQCGGVAIELMVSSVLKCVDLLRW